MNKIQQMGILANEPFQDALPMLGGYPAAAG
jgi:hypothetical protein